MEAIEAIRSPRTGVTDVYEPSCRFIPFSPDFFFSFLFLFCFETGFTLCPMSLDMLPIHFIEFCEVFNLFILDLVVILLSIVKFP